MINDTIHILLKSYFELLSTSVETLKASAFRRMCSLPLLNDLLYGKLTDYASKDKEFWEKFVECCYPELGVQFLSASDSGGDEPEPEPQPVDPSEIPDYITAANQIKLFTEGNTFRFGSNGIVRLYYKDGHSEEVTEWCTFEPEQGSILYGVGEQTVTVTYIKNGEVFTTTYTITVQAAPVEVTYWYIGYASNLPSGDGLINASTAIDINTKVANSGTVTGTRFWIAVPSNMRLVSAANTSVLPNDVGDEIPFAKFELTIQTLRGQAYNVYHTQSVLPFYSAYNITIE